MSNQSGFQLYSQSMNGLLSIDNADTINVYELDASIINTDNLSVNNLLTVPFISDATIGTITQSSTSIITQSGSGKNLFKNTDISGNLYVRNNVDISGNLNVSGSITYDIVDIDCENLKVQNDASLNRVNVSGNITQTGIISQSGSGTNTLKNTTIGTITQSSTNVITQTGTGSNTLKNTTIGTITQTDTGIITQTGTGVNVFKDTYVDGDFTATGAWSSITQINNGIISQTGTGTNLLKDTDINGDLEVQGDASFNNINVSGDLQVDNVLQIFNVNQSITGVSQPNNTKHQLLAGTTFTVKAGYNIDFTITIVCPIAFQHEGVNNGGVNNSQTILNSRTTSIKKNGVFLQNANTSSQNNAIPTPVHQFNFGSNGNFNYNKYFTTLTNTFTINHVGSSTDTLYEVFYTFNWTTTQILVTNTSIGFYLNTTTTFFTETGVTTSTTPALGTFDYANNWTTPSFNVVYNSYSPIFTPNTNLFENVYRITCDQINTNNLIVENDVSVGGNLVVDNDLTTNNAYVNEILDVENVSNFNPTIQLKEFIFDKTIITTGLFVGSATTIYSFDVDGGNRPRTITINYSTPLALSESGTVGIPQTGLRSTINSVVLSIYRDGVEVASTNGTKTNTTDPKYNITSAGAYNYKQFVNIITGSISYTETSTTTKAYELKMAINNTRSNSGGTYGYEANTTATGITKSANVTNLETFTNWSAGEYTVIVANQTPVYSTDTGTLTNNALVNNYLFNKAEFNLLNFATSGNFTLTTTYSYYMISRAGNTTINLPFLDNNYRGFIVWMRKAVPTANNNHITLNCNVNGVTYYDTNMTAITTSKQYNTEVAFHLLYAGSGIWYSLNHH
jgi:hypothetical protein